MDISIDDGALAEMLAHYVEPWLAAKVDSIAMLARQECPVGADDELGRARRYPDHMRDTISSAVEGSGFEWVGWVTIGAPYAAAVHEGSRPHEIPTGGAAAQKAKGYPLRFPKNGMVIRAWKVNHPGNAPNPFLRNAMIHVISASP